MTHRDTFRLDQLAHNMRRDAKLVDTLQASHQAAQDHVTRELSVLGWPRRGDSVSVSGGGDGLTSVERDADLCYDLTSLREDVRDQVEATLAAYRGFCRHLEALGIIIHTTQRAGLSRAERERMKLERDKPTVCADNQHGKHGVEEWGDALCFLPSVKAGLCRAHYMAWYRRRQADGIDISRDFGAAS